MDEKKFWSLIAEARAEVEGSPDELQDLLDAVEERLEQLPDEEIARFQQIMRELYWKAYTYELSAALYVITDEKCDDADFHAFRGWLVAQGEEAFSTAVENADSLAGRGIIASEVFLPQLLTLGQYVYRESTGEDPPWDLEFIEPKQPQGTPFGIDEIPQRLPRLCDEFFFTVEQAEEEEEEETPT